MLGKGDEYKGEFRSAFFPFGLSTMTTRDTQGVGPVTCSMISCSSSCFNLASTLER